MIASAILCSVMASSLEHQIGSTFGIQSDAQFLEQRIVWKTGATFR
jgi:hypothetical protein